MFVDISMPIEEGSVFRPGCAPVDISVHTFSNETEGTYEAAVLTMPLHTATHIDFVFPGKEFPMERMIGPGRVFDVTKAGGGTFGLKDLGKNPEADKGDFIFFRTNWNRFFGTDKYFEHPEISMEVLDWLILKKINVVGIDAQGLARGTRHGEYDRLMLKNDIPVVENLVNLTVLPESGFTVYCFPVKIKNADALPVRVVAEIKKE